MIVNTSVWGDIEIPRQSALPKDKEADLVVIGLGGSGLAAIGKALERKLKVIGIDAGFISNGAAGKNGGLLLGGIEKFKHDADLQLGRKRSVEIYRRTLEQMELMQRHTRHCVRKTGSLRIACDDEEFDDCMVHMHSLQRDGFRANTYAGREGRGIVIHQDGVFHPMKYALQTVNDVVYGGAELHEETKAMKIEQGRVETDQGVIRCRDIIVAVDGKLDVLFPGLRPEVVTHRLQMFSTGREQLTFPRPIYYRWGKDYLHQLSFGRKPDGRIAAGGCRDLHESDEKTSNTEPTDAVQDSIEKIIRGQFGVTAPTQKSWGASVAFTKSGLPIAKQMGTSESNVIVIGGYNGTGNLVGRHMGEEAVRAILSKDWRGLELFTAEP